jgi:hypothetical protein
VSTLRLYRLVPRRVRRRLLASMPLSRKLRLARWVFRSPAEEDRAGLGPAGAPRRLRRRDRRRVRPRISDDATPQSVREHNLDLVVRALDEAGVGYFCLPRPGLRSAVAVELDDQPVVRHLLREDPRLRHAHVRYTRVGRAAHRRRRGRPGPAGPPDPMQVLRVWEPVTSQSGTWMLGEGYACDIEFWRRAEDRLQGPRAGQAYGAVPRDDPPATVPEWVLNPHLPASPHTRRRLTRATLAHPPIDRVEFPIDAVYTWVDGADPHWQRRKAAALSALTAPGALTDAGPPTGADSPALECDATGSARYTSRDELRYSLRSVICFAPWIQRIFLVTDDQLPPWLDPDHPMITMVTHRDLFGDTGRLPSFNSHAIESRLHLIPGLAEHVLYLNDDVFLGRPLLPSTFFLANGIARYFPSPAAIDPLPPAPDEATVTIAAKNNRQHLIDIFGRGVTQKMRHVPHALRRSVLVEIEQRLPDAVLATAAHQFRHPQDLAMVSSLHHYWSFLGGTSVPGRIRYAYGAIGHPSTPVKLARLLATRSYDVFCLNDVGSATDDLEQRRMLADFLPAYLPFRAPFELPEPETARRARLTATERATRFSGIRSG